MTLAASREAQQLLENVAHRTPLIHSTTFSSLTGAEVYLKCETLQRTGSFKIRGAYVKLSSLSTAQRSNGVTAASAGNHAQGVALAARMLGIKATIFMPINTPLAKLSATEGYGAVVRLEGGDYTETTDAARRFADESGAELIHAFDDPLVIAGQGTIGLEILEQLPDVQAIVVPVGGGGMIAGIASAVKELSPNVSVFGVQAAGAACFRASLAAGKPVTLPRASTIADGIAVRRPGDEPFRLISKLVDEMVTVEDEEISHALVMLLERAKLLTEPAGAVGLAALLSGRLRLDGKKVAVVVSGGNVDINLLARIIEHGLATSGRYLTFETWLPDRPGELLRLLEPLTEQRVNILSVEHRRPASFPEVEVMLTVETRDFAHGEALLSSLEERGYRTRRLRPGSLE